MGEHDIFGAHHQRVFLGKAQVAPRPNVDDGLFWFGFHKELNAIAVLAEVGEHTKDKGQNGSTCHDGHDWVACDELDEITENGALTTPFNALAFPLDGCRVQNDRRQH